MLTLPPTTYAVTVLVNDAPFTIQGPQTSLDQVRLQLDDCFSPGKTLQFRVEEVTRDHETGKPEAIRDITEDVMDLIEANSKRVGLYLRPMNDRLYEPDGDDCDDLHDDLADRSAFEGSAQ